MAASATATMTQKRANGEIIWLATAGKSN